jgi:uncharacterized protein
MENNNIEIRSISYSPDNVNTGLKPIGDGRHVEGYGIVFNSESNELQGTDSRGMTIRFKEIILPSAVEGVVQRSDVMALLNHDLKRGILARSIKGKGSLKLNADKNGLKYSFEAPKYALGDELVENIKRGDVVGSSFSFSVAEGGDKYQKRNNGTYLRTISQFDQIYDVSPVYQAAYNDTTVATRKLEEFRNVPEVPVEVKPEKKLTEMTPIEQRDYAIEKRGYYMKRINAIMSEKIDYCNSTQKYDRDNRLDTAKKSYELYELILKDANDKLNK